MECYLDNAATTKPFDSVTDIMVEVLKADYGNPSSMHRKGVDAEKYIRHAREQVAKTLKCDAKNIVFTSGGTESNNTAIFGAVKTNSYLGKHIITTPFEHDSVGKCMKALEKDGYEITYLPVDDRGRIDPEVLKNTVRPDTILVSVMHVNNEIGVLEPVEEIADIVHHINPNTAVHVDAIQSYGKYNIRPSRAGIDFLSASGHKIHGPKGVGFLYVADPVKFKPLILGGGQQSGMRSGTENVPGIAGLGQAAEEIYTGHNDRVESLKNVRNIFIKEVSKVDGVQINGPAADLFKCCEPKPDAAPHIVSVSFSGVRAEVLLHALEDKGVYCSAGSACSTNHTSRTHSGTLSAIGIDKSLLESTLRFSFGTFTTEDEVLYAAAQIAEIVPFLRQFKRD